MTNLTTKQIELLRAASGAEDGAVDAPKDAKMVRSLIKRGLLIGLPQAQGPSHLIITETGRTAVAALAPTPAPAATAKHTRKGEAQAETEAKGPTPAANPAAPATPTGKLGVLVTLLRDEAGATVEAMSAATGWQAHSVRGAIAGALKKRLGFTVTSQKTETGRFYRIVGEANA